MKGLGSCSLDPVNLFPDIGKIFVKMIKRPLNHLFLSGLVLVLGKIHPVIKLGVHGGNYGISVIARPGFRVIHGKSAAGGIL